MALLDCEPHPLLNHASKFFGFTFDMLTSFDENEFICKLCTGLLNNPIYTGCCGTSFCRHCIEEAASGDDTSCPKCKKPNVSYVRDHRLEKQMKESTITCRYRGKGCVWTGSIYELADHTEDPDGCPFTVLPCPKECGATVERCNLSEHLAANCNISWTKCEYCHELIPTTSIDTHVTTLCPQFELRCPNNCPLFVKRLNMAKHREVCPNELIPCPFKEAGCDIGTFKRNTLQEHLMANQITHSLLTFKSLTNELTSLKEQLQKVEVEGQIQKREIGNLKKSLAIVKQELSSVIDRNVMLATSLNQELSYISEQPHTSSAKTLAIACLRDQLAFLSNPLLLKLYPTGPPLTFRLPQFSQLKAADLQWVSLPFVVQNGYQMCIVVHPNGQGEGRSTHLSIYLHLVAGRYDDEVTWPLHFDDEIVISLMRQNSPSEQPQKGSIWRRGSSMENTSMASGNNLFVVQQKMRVLVHIIRRVNKSLMELGLPFGFIELFCAQSSIDATCLYNDSLIFQLSIPSKNRTLM